ncbi:YheO-like [Moorella glycerini]|uniref:YheO-like PAS domain protein n=1 Tax=Neomoorella stamsii TaxID=1266720 RepID=A0A9X7P5P8_9FIRM|nr:MULTISPECIES: helix-turn-helix transcriptional regulator [Moorella]PRR71889.1 YheO-like PAS domain protein [Moorella stamsii]CEP66107.1 YheO-like [Moorella glycerini]
MTSVKIHPALEAMKPVARGIAATFGKNCEVVLHDLSEPSSSLIFKAGSVTNREIGAPVTNLVLEALQRYGDATEDLIGYLNRTKDGKVLKSSTIFIRDNSGKIVGCLCINFDLTEFQLAKNILEDFCQLKDLAEAGFERTQEQFARDINEVVDNVVENVLQELGKPVPVMTKEEKVKAVEMLDDRGIFLVKGAVDVVAQALAVSKYTIYNYLEEARALKGNRRAVL